MNTRTDELKNEIAQFDRNIEAQRTIRDARFQRVKLIDEYISVLEKQRARRVVELQREEAPRQLEQAAGHVAESPDGVLWKV